jgi:predicted TIM-barrel fold metal-dependent hydrolase
VQLGHHLHSTYANLQNLTVGSQKQKLESKKEKEDFEKAQALDVPIYIHPADPPQEIKDAYYKDWPVLAQIWGWQVDTGTHLLRLMSAGVFDRCPDLKIIIGHVGELIPFTLDRINRGLTLANWRLDVESKDFDSSQRTGMQKSILFYMRHNVFITTSGVFGQPALNCAIAELGIDNVLFSVDDPFGDNFEGVAFLNKAQLSMSDKEKLAHGNAERILKLSPNVGSRKRSGRSFFSFQAKIKAKIARAMMKFLVR